MNLAPRALHPAAWWLWAITLGAAAIRTTNPFLLLLMAAVAWYVTAARRIDAPWARSIGSFARIGLVVLVFRLALQALFGVRTPGHTLVTLPSVELPRWAAGVSIGGPVTSEAMLLALYAGLQLAVLLICVGAANSLSSPYRLLRATPAVLYEAGVAVTMALSFAPLATASARQVREMRRLRGRPSTGPRGLRGLAVPVLESALEQSLRLAASMDAKGYGRRGTLTSGRRMLTRAALVIGLLGVLVGAYGLLDAGGGPAAFGLPALGAGAILLVASLALGAGRSSRTRYRPDLWRGPEWLTLVSGGAALAGLVVVGKNHPGALAPTPDLGIPPVPLVAVFAILLAALPAFATPQPAP